MRYAICNELFENWSWEDTCRSAAAVGYQGIEVAPFTLAADIRELDAAARTNIYETAEAFSLEITGLHWLLVSPKGLSVTDEDAEVRGATGKYLVSLVDFCADLGGKTLVFGSPNQRRLPAGGAEVAADRYCTALRPALVRARERGVVFCLEPLPAPEADFLLTLSDALSLIKRLDNPAAKTVLDVKSACSENISIPDLIRQYAPWISHVHANDANRRGPGFGDTDFQPIMAALKEIGYDGWVSVEPFDYSPDPVTVAQKSLETLKRA